MVTIIHGWWLPIPKRCGSSQSIIPCVWLKPIKIWNPTQIPSKSLNTWPSLLQITSCNGQLVTAEPIDPEKSEPAPNLEGPCGPFEFSGCRSPVLLQGQSTWMQDLHLSKGAQKASRRAWSLISNVWRKYVSMMNALIPEACVTVYVCVCARMCISP